MYLLSCLFFDPWQTTTNQNIHRVLTKKNKQLRTTWTNPEAPRGTHSPTLGYLSGSLFAVCKFDSCSFRLMLLRFSAIAVPVAPAQVGLFTPRIFWAHSHTIWPSIASSASLIISSIHAHSPCPPLTHDSFNFLTCRTRSPHNFSLSKCYLICEIGCGSTPSSTAEEWICGVHRGRFCGREERGTFSFSRNLWDWLWAESLVLLTILEELDSEFEEEKKGLVRGEFLFKVCLSSILCNLLFLQAHTHKAIRFWQFQGFFIFF